MAPKKKGNKKAQDDDWEAELGESVAPQDNTAVEAKSEDVAAEDDAAGGGLMAALAKRGKKKNKKGGANLEVEGEDPPPVDGANGDDFESKAPQEGTFDDDDEDVFAGNYGKKKAKGGAAAKVEEPVEARSESPADGAPRVKTKAEKEKEKKEKEKQRKKELVGLGTLDESLPSSRLTSSSRLRRRRPPVLRKPSPRSPPNPSHRLPPHPLLLHLLQMPLPLPAARRRSSTLR
jgi:hypothetical protein